jgi:hypothetical protein
LGLLRRSKAHHTGFDSTDFHLIDPEQSVTIQEINREAAKPRRKQYKSELSRTTRFDPDRIDPVVLHFLRPLCAFAVIRI